MNTYFQYAENVAVFLSLRMASVTGLLGNYIVPTGMRMFSYRKEYKKANLLISYGILYVKYC